MPKVKEDLLKKTLFIPLEIIDREIDGGCLLALEAVKRGWKVIIGSQREITKSIESNEIGVYFLKSITPGQINLQKRILNSGSLIFCQDAEGLLQRPGKSRLRFSEESLSCTQKVFFWGNQQKADFINTFGNKYESICLVTGSPRADHWELISRLNDKHKMCSEKKFILIATSFGNENHALGKAGQYNLSADEAGLKYGANTVENFNKYFQDMYKLGFFLIPYYQKLIKDLSQKFPDENFILRPHPSENPDVWKDIITPLPNVVLRNDGSIIDWLNKSKVLIHNGSTCAFQSNILKIPVISLIPELPDSIKDYDIEYARKASFVYSNIPELLKDLDDFLKGKINLLPVNFDYLDKLIFSRNTVDSSKRIMEVIDEVYKNNKKVKRVKNLRNFDYKINQCKRNILLLLSFLPFWSKFAPQKYKHFSLKTYLYYKNRKQPKQSLIEFKDRINYLKKLSSFKKDLQVKQYKKNVFEIF